MLYCFETVSQGSVFKYTNEASFKCPSKKLHCQYNVPMFSTKTCQQYSSICSPYRLHKFHKGSHHSRIFRFYYERGDLPCSISHTSKGQSLKWFVENIELLDLDHYLPIFTDGLCETIYPYSVIALHGVFDFLEHASHKIDPLTLSKMILPLKRALYIQDSVIITRILLVLQKLAAGNDGTLGISLVPYFNQLLPVINIIKDRNERILCRSQEKCERIDDDYEKDIPSSLLRLIYKTLFILEQYGGPDAYINIKYSIPTYEQQFDAMKLTNIQQRAFMKPLMEIL